jgi:hypothetical protein
VIHFRKRLNIIDVIKAFFYFKKLDLSNWKKNKYQKSLILSKSSWSILLIGIWLKRFKNKNPIFLVPDYYCNYSLSLLKIFGAKIIFYSIKENFEPDFDSIKLSTKPDVLIAAHYFGKEFDFNKLSDYCSAKKIWFIEDATHCLKKNGKIGNHGHFVIFSQHKFFPNINGALLILNEKKFTNEELTTFGNENTWIKILNQFISSNGIKTYNNNFRMILNIIYDNLFKIFISEKIKDFDINYYNQKKYSHPNIDLISYKLLSFFSQKEIIISDYRKRCHLISEILLKKVLNKDDYEILSNIEYDPYFLIIKSKNKTLKIFNLLKKLGIAVQSWPDLNEKIGKDTKAFFLRQNLLFIPLNKISLDKISNENDSNNSFPIELTECVDQKQWELLSNKFHLNILQTWEYGNFKEKNLFAKTKRFLIYDDKKNLIGLYQAIFYQFFGIKLIFINRGPILKSNFNNDTRKFIIKEILSRLKKKFLTFILIKPELELIKDNIVCNFNSKLSYYKFPFWCSSQIDLKQDQLTIFKNFKNSLKSEILKGEKLIEIEIENQEKNYKWICEKYFSSSNKKKFKTLDHKLTRSLNTKNIISFCASNNGDICSGIIFYSHGNTATYLMSYNSNIGKMNYGNQVLLWEMIKYLKKNHYSFLDLGGIDMNFNLSVAKFKLAFNGKLYKLIGTNFI